MIRSTSTPTTPFLIWEVTDLSTNKTYTIQLSWDTAPTLINLYFNRAVESLHLPKSHKLTSTFTGDWGWIKN